MAKRAERVARAEKTDKGGRWTVRGVPTRLQKAAGEAARARGLTLGQWLSETLTGATRAARSGAPAAPAWEETVERRLARLEDVVLGSSDGAGPETTTSSARGSAPAQSGPGHA